jgi:cystathionine beta-lyase/cystathionine gamma-synthase
MATNPKDPNSPSWRVDWSHVAFETRAIRAGQDPCSATGSVIVPIYQTTTYRHKELGIFDGYEYSRTDNPTRTALQASLASLEQGAWGLAFASGTAATREIATLLNPGDHILMADEAYGGTYRLFVTLFGRYGVETSIVDLSDLDASRAAVRITDIAGLAEISRSAGALLVVDNTFATPYLQQPLMLGADLVLHSTTKYLGGHSDVTGGAVIGNDPELYLQLKDLQNSAGATPGPMDCWLTLRGIRTLPVRMDRHSENGQKIAEFLCGHPAVEHVFYPGLKDHPGHELAANQMRSFGGMVSFAAKGGYEAAKKIVEGTKIFILAESLGGVESLIEHPDTMTHAAVSGTAAAIDPGVIRMSVGIENANDLIADLEQALA